MSANVNFEFKSKTGRKRERKEKSVDITSEFLSANKKFFPIENQKNVVCKSVKEGLPCSYGSKCIFSHYVDEIKPNECPFGDRCYHVNYDDHCVVNTDAKNRVCFNIHPEEGISNWLFRNGFDESRMQRPVQDLSFTRMCVSFIKNIPCGKGDGCTYAHRVEELKTIPCNFGQTCIHVKKDGDKYVNTSETEKVCVFIHPEESLDNYETRALRTFPKKRKGLEDNRSAKRMKIDDNEFPSLPCLPMEKIDDKEKESFEPKIEDVKDRIIINVPSKMAVEMVEMLIKNGTTNFQLITY
jgi:hypothetical protein